MARHGLREREDGLFELKIDPALRGVGVDEPNADALAAHEAERTKSMWEALGRISCPTR